MKKLLAIAAFGIGIAISAPLLAAGPQQTVTLYKNPQCGCCENYADYLRDNGFAVDVQPTHDLVAMSRKAGIPDDFQGCHLAFVDGYAVSGHVPIETVRRVLDERPAIKGVTLPGMPAGSPGMGGRKSAPFTIYEIGSETPRVYATE
tara:strand:+ start:297 stop:737 length:441 start_codon:yes stop_codon:yes gene_type:complete